MLFPDLIVPEESNPIVESTDITLESIRTFSKHFVFGVILKVPSIVLESSYPTKR